MVASLRTRRRRSGRKPNVQLLQLQKVVMLWHLLRQMGQTTEEIWPQQMRAVLVRMELRNGQKEIDRVA
jgi:hypothetical protein